jgi:asparagine synthase (glutamine-hydrolysing)
MWSNDKRYCIVYNGELYNFKELRFDLERSSRGSSDMPYHFITKSDTEVILAAYSRWGKDCLSKFNGMFGFAIWDTEKKELFIARDRLGVKPIYYSLKNNTLVFSSELRSLLESNIIPRKLNKDGLVDYLRYQTVHAPQTIVRDVFMLMPGHFIKASINSWTSTGAMALDGTSTLASGMQGCPAERRERSSGSFTQSPLSDGQKPIRMPHSSS